MECGEGLNGQPEDRQSPLLQRSRTRWSAESRWQCGTLRRLRLGFNGAALVGVRRAISSSSKSSNSISFNGAALVGVRRAKGNRGNSGTRVLASTEPHSLECGEQIEQFVIRARFVASTEPHSLECGELLHPFDVECPHVGFNGAALVGVRRARSASGKVEHGTWLQRSRTRWSAESGITAAVLEFLGGLQRSRTRWSAERCEAGFSVFLVALLQRSRTRWSAERIWLETRKGEVAPASTEPHSLECGESRLWGFTGSRLPAALGERRGFGGLRIWETEKNGRECLHFQGANACGGWKHHQGARDE